MNLLGKRVILFGDSQVQGLAPSLSRLLTAAGAVEVGVSANPGVSLKTASETLQGTTSGYEVVLVSFGGNNPPSTAARAFAYMQALLAPMQGKTVYWLTVLPAEDAVLQVGRARMAAWQKRYLPSHGVTVLDGDALSAGLTRRDGLHLTSGGYARLADRIARKMTAAATPLWPWLVLGGLVIGAGAYALTRRRGSFNGVEVLAQEGGDNEEFRAYCDGTSCGLLKVQSRDGFVEVSSIAVISAFQRQHVATRLYEAAHRWSCNRGKTLISTTRIARAHSNDFWDKQLRKGRAVVIEDNDEPHNRKIAIRNCDVFSLDG